MTLSLLVVYVLLKILTHEFTPREDLRDKWRKTLLLYCWDDPEVVGPGHCAPETSGIHVLLEEVHYLQRDGNRSHSELSMRAEIRGMPLGGRLDIVDLSIDGDKKRGLNSVSSSLCRLLVLSVIYDLFFGQVEGIILLIHRGKLFVPAWRPAALTNSANSSTYLHTSVDGQLHLLRLISKSTPDV
ncbi:hypothetical protein C8R46DRAFT_1214442 [Mycena filopes]|nr:hypothetical protein C8R46DRAFT_1214442 [Mycena filopes]